MRRWSLLALAGLAVAACETTPPQGPVELSVRGAYVQAATGMEFPDRVGGFERVGVTRYRPDGSDESAGYASNPQAGAAVIATVYVYPSPTLIGALGSREANRSTRAQLCQSEFELTWRYIGGALEMEVPTLLAQGDTEYVGRVATVQIQPGEPSSFSTEGLTLREPLRSHVYLFCYVGGEWNVKYRFTHLASQDASGLIADFMRDLTITVPGGQAELGEPDPASDHPRSVVLLTP